MIRSNLFLSIFCSICCESNFKYFEASVNSLVELELSETSDTPSQDDNQKKDQGNKFEDFESVFQKEMEKPIAISNIAILSPKNKKATRVRIETRDGKKVRVACSCGSVIN